MSCDSVVIRIAASLIGMWVILSVVFLIRLWRLPQMRKRAHIVPLREALGSLEVTSRIVLRTCMSEWFELISGPFRRTDGSVLLPRETVEELKRVRVVELEQLPGSLQAMIREQARWIATAAERTIIHDHEDKT